MIPPLLTAQLPPTGTVPGVVAPPTNPKVASSPELLRLRRAAGEFESILLESLWKSMKETFADSEDQNSDPTLKSFDDWGIQAMAGAVGNSGGLGIKDLILKYLEPALAGGSQGQSTT